MSKLVKNIESISVNIVFYCIVDSTEYDLGIMELRRGDKCLKMDVSDSEVSNENNHTTISCDLVFDSEITNDTKGDISVSDLVDLDVATLYIGAEYTVEPESITLFVQNDGTTMAIELDVD